MSAESEDKMHSIDSCIIAVDDAGFEVAEGDRTGEHRRIDFIGQDARIQVGRVVHLRIRKAARLLRIERDHVRAHDRRAAMLSPCPYGRKSRHR
ncbi:MAG: hypothetical protein PHS73_02200 [Candidatus Peribacteraceae bacterium]|nr:hypothetical protein [Candidatus Peribacteraceae bacterium]